MLWNEINIIGKLVVIWLKQYEIINMRDRIVIYFSSDEREKSYLLVWKTGYDQINIAA